MPEEAPKGFVTYYIGDRGHPVQLPKPGQRTQGFGVDIIPAKNEDEEARLRVWRDPPSEMAIEVQDIMVKKRRPGVLGLILPRKVKARVKVHDVDHRVDLNVSQLVAMLRVAVFEEGLVEEKLLANLMSDLRKLFRSADGSPTWGVPGGDATETDGARA